MDGEDFNTPSYHMRGSNSPWFSRNTFSTNFQIHWVKLFCL